ncbi:MAG: aldose epimerase family protein [Rubricella sp.]
MRRIGTLDGRDVVEAVLEDGDTAIHVMNYGAVIRDWRYSVDGRALPMVLGFPDFETYPEHSRAFGVIAGRVANRIAGGRFTLDGVDYTLPINNGPNHLHGGPEGLGKVLWDLETDGQRALRLVHTSPDGHMGYPGNVRFSVEMRLGGGQLEFDMRAEADRPTPINLAQHNYYTLGATSGIRDVALFVDADRYTPVDETLIPTGEIVSVEGTRFDFRTPRSVREADPDGAVFDQNLVLREDRDVDTPAARAVNRETGIELRLWTDQPGIQLFDSAPFSFPVKGHDGITMDGWPGVCFEPQHFPDSVNRPDWPSIIYGPDRPYRQTLRIEIARL